MSANGRTRHTKRSPCPVCAGGTDMPQGRGVRCAGYTTADREWVYCTREEYANGAQLIEKCEPPAYKHRRQADGTYRPWTEQPPGSARRSSRKEKQGQKSHTNPPGRRIFTYSPAERVVRIDYANGSRSIIPYHLANGEWVKGYGPNPTRVYNRDLIAGASLVYLVEGEPCADALTERGQTAVTWPGGTGQAEKAIEQLTVALTGKEVAILPDADGVGRNAMRDIAPALLGNAASVRWVDLYPDDESRRDIEDYFAAGGTLDDLTARVAATAEYEPEATHAGDGHQTTARPRTQAAGLMALADDLTLFHDVRGEPYVILRVDGHEETHPLMTKAVRRFLSRRYFEAVGKSVGSQALQDALTTLAGNAMFAGEEHAVHVRLAEHAGECYLDLANPEWQVVRIDRTGWTVIAAADAPVRFRRPKGMLALPVPRTGGSIARLKPFINISDEHWPLLVGWLIGALRPSGPYCVLAIAGEQGTAKSTLLRVLRALIDPNIAAIRSPARDERDLVIAATNGWVLAFDNSSAIPIWLSDAFCRISTGGGFSTRTLYENDEETIFSSMRPIALNGIADVVTRGDLADRAIAFTLSTIVEDERKTEAALWAAFEQERPRILGALLDAVSAAIRNLPTTHLKRLPRMADAALWVVAAESALPWEPGAFLTAYDTNRAEASTLILEDSPVALAVIALMEGRTVSWEGTATALLAQLTKDIDEAQRKRDGWPKKPNGLSGVLRRLAPNLRAAGVEVIFDREGRKSTRTITLERVGERSSASSASSAQGDFASDGKEHHADDHADDHRDADDHADDHRDADDHADDHDTRPSSAHEGSDSKEHSHNGVNTDDADDLSHPHSDNTQRGAPSDTPDPATPTAQTTQTDDEDMAWVDAIWGEKAVADDE